jgi:hypothetical protein
VTQRWDRGLEIALEIAFVKAEATEPAQYTPWRSRGMLGALFCERWVK